MNLSWYFVQTQDKINKVYNKQHKLQRKSAQYKYLLTIYLHLITPKIKWKCLTIYVYIYIYLQRMLTIPS